MKKLFLLFLAAVAVTAIVFYTRPNEQGKKSVDEKNATYTIEGRSVTLVNGVSQEANSTVRFFGNEIRKDLNGDGKEDVAFLITEDSEGSGTFFYVVAAIASDEGYVGSDAYLLGDRIAPQTTESGSGTSIIVNYADRRPDEPFTTQPSVGKSARLNLDSSTLMWSSVNE